MRAGRRSFAVLCGVLWGLLPLLPATAQEAPSGASSSASPGAAAAAPVPAAAREACRNALALSRSGHLEAAEVQLNTALSLAPGYGEAWWVNGWVKLGLHRKDAALRAFQKASALLPANDPRLPEARQRASLLAQELAPKATLSRVTPHAAPPPSPAASFLLGWPLALFTLGLLVCLAAAALALRQDAALGADSAAGRFVRLAPRCAAGDAQPVGAVLAMAEDPVTGAWPVEDLAAPVRLGAAHSALARERLVKVLAGSRGRVRQVAALALAGQDEQPEPAVWTPLLADPDLVLRQAALEALSRRPDPEAGPGLLALALDTAAAQAVQAVRGLTRLPSDAAPTALLTVCGQAATTEARAQAAEALASRRQLAAALVPVLAAQWRAPDAIGADSLVRALGAAGAPAAGELLAALLDGRPGVRRTAQQVLLTGEAALHVAAPLTTWLEDLAAAPERVTMEALELAVGWVPEESLAVLDAVLARVPLGAPTRGRTVTHLATVGGDAATRLLQRSLGALPVAAGLAPAQAAELHAVAAALVRIVAVEALPALLEHAALAGGEGPAWSAVVALADDPAAGPWVAQAAAPGAAAKVRRLAIRLLADHPRPEAIEALLAEVSRAGTPAAEPATIRLAALALGKLDVAAALEPLGALRERHPECAGDELDVALARLGDAAARSCVEAMLVRPTAAERRPAADYFRGRADVPPRALEVVAQADAQDAAWRLLLALDPADDTAARLAALGPPVRPALEAWLASGWELARVTAALALLDGTGQPTAT